MFPEALVLVAILNNRRDFAIAKTLGWYRIPLKHAPRTIQVDYLAFYQTAAFGDEKWAIHYYAQVRGHELVTRRDLFRDQPDHPRAGEWYYKLQLGPLERLPRPIPSRTWRRITFLLTTGERLMQAEEINDLVLGSPEQERLWRALKEAGIAAERGYILRERRASYTADFAIFCREGILAISCGPDAGDALALPHPPGWRALHLDAARLSAALPEVVAAVQAAVAELGGLAQALPPSPG
jgi:hypothetical protein